MLGKAGEQIRAKMKNKCKPVALDVWLHQEQEKAWHKEREIREIAHQKRQAEREIAHQKRQAEREVARQQRQAERAAAAAERRATRHAVVRALEASLRQDKDYRFGVQPCPWYALYGDCKSEKCGRDHRPCLVREALLAHARKVGGEKRDWGEKWERMSQGSSTDTVVCGKC